MITEALLVSFIGDLKTAAHFYEDKDSEQYRLLLSKIEVLEWILE